MLKRIAVAGIVLVSLLGMPNRSDAGLLEFIWDMSGPQMINGGFGCNFYLSRDPANPTERTKNFDCRPQFLGASPLTVKNEVRATVFRTLASKFRAQAELAAPELREELQRSLLEQALPTYVPRVTFLVGGEGGFSTGRNDNGVEYKAFRTWRIAATPEANLRVHGSIHAAAGVSWEYFHSADDKFEAFHKCGFVFTPIEAVTDDVSIGIKVRLYPDGFTADEFASAVHLDYDRPHETTIGFNVTFPLHRQPH